MTNSMVPCEVAILDIASWMVATVNEEKLVLPFEMPELTRDERREMCARLAESLFAEYRFDDRLLALLDRLGANPRSRLSGMRDALFHYVGEAYANYASTYPNNWFEEYRVSFLGLTPVTKPVVGLVFMPPTNTVLADELLAEVVA